MEGSTKNVGVPLGMDKNRKVVDIIFVQVVVLYRGIKIGYCVLKCIVCRIE